MTHRRRFRLSVAFVVAAFVPSLSAGEEPIVVGSKKFTESVVLGEMLLQVGRSTGGSIVHQREFGGTRILWNALVRGDIDAYPEYSGTLLREILASHNVESMDEARPVLESYGIRTSGALGFNNTYAIGVLREIAKSRSLSRVSDLRAHSDLRFAFSNEFMERQDGWDALRQRYSLPQTDVRGMDHDLAYRGLLSKAVDATDFYATDAEISHHSLMVLDDDLKHFPRYDALILFRADLETRAPKVVAAMRRLEGRIDAVVMTNLNREVKFGGASEAEVAAGFLREALSLSIVVDNETRATRLLRHSREHLTLVGVSLLVAVLIAVPLGIVAAKRPWLGQFVLAATGILQTIPSLALLVFMIPLLGIGKPAAVAALFFYSLLPIVRNTHAGLCGIRPDLRESAEAVGLPPRARLFQIELPLASPSILAGIKTAAVINVGTATLGALIGAGGLGSPILTGIRLDDYGLILQGAIPAAGLAVAIQVAFDVAERFLVPRGLRLQRQ